MRPRYQMSNKRYYRASAHEFYEAVKHCGQYYHEYRGPAVKRFMEFLKEVFKHTNIIAQNGENNN